MRDTEKSNCLPIQIRCDLEHEFDQGDEKLNNATRTVLVLKSFNHRAVEGLEPIRSYDFSTIFEGSGFKKLGIAGEIP
jgi:hypothetical protein